MKNEIRTAAEAYVYYAGLRSRGLLTGTIKRAVEIWKERRIIGYGEDNMQPSAFLAIPLSVVHKNEARSRAVARRPRVQRWIDPVGTIPRRGFDADGYGYSELDRGEYSRGCTYHKIDYEPWWVAYGYASRRHLYARIGNRKCKRHAPRGWNFERVWGGLYLTRRTKRARGVQYYRLQSADILGGVAAMRAAAIRKTAADPDQRSAHWNDRPFRHGR